MFPSAVLRLVRYALTLIAAALGFILLDARITQLDVPGLDSALKIHAVSFVFTVFAVTGVSQSINLIDGLNGLAGVVGLLGAIGLAIVAAIVGDSLVFPAACALAASVAGFLLVNYPRGRIFLGDGGAYLVGLLLAELAVLLGAPQLRGVALVPARSARLPDLGDPVHRLPARAPAGIRPRARMRCTCTRSCTGAWCAGAASRESRRTTWRAIRSLPWSCGSFRRRASWSRWFSGRSPCRCSSRPRHSVFFTRWGTGGSSASVFQPWLVIRAPGGQVACRPGGCWRECDNALREGQKKGMGGNMLRILLVGVLALALPLAALAGTVVESFKGDVQVARRGWSSRASGWFRRRRSPPGPARRSS